MARAASCVNINHPDFKSLLERSSMNSFELELAVSDWQIARNTDSFPNPDNITAPNGKPSKLFNDLGKLVDNPLESYLQVYSPQFLAWFGDWVNNDKISSKVVDENGEPMIVYHGTTANIEQFKKEFLGTYTKAGSAFKGFFFTNNPLVAETYVSEERLGQEKFKYERNKNLVDKIGKLDVKDIEQEIKYFTSLTNDATSLGIKADKEYYLGDTDIKVYAVKEPVEIPVYKGEEIVGTDIVYVERYFQEKRDIRPPYNIITKELSNKTMSTYIDMKRINTYEPPYKYNLKAISSKLEMLEKIRSWLEIGVVLPKLPVDKSNYERNYGKSSFGSLDNYVYNKYGELDVPAPSSKPFKNILPVFLSIDNPVVYDYDSKKYRDKKYNDIINEGLKNNNNGAIFYNTYDAGFKKDDHYISHINVAFEPNQIKHIKNTGIFSKIDEGIFYELEGGTDQSEVTDKQVKEKLLEVLNKNGITVTSMSEYMENYKLRTGENITVKGLADTTRNIIAVDDTGSDTGTLVEEAGHMSVASQVGTAAFNRAMRLVETTDEYQNNYDQYLRAYKEQGLSDNAAVRKVKMEVLGKLMKSSIFSNLTDTTEGTGIRRYLRRIWNAFMKLFRAATPELNRILDKWAADFVSGGAEIANEGVFYELEEEVLSEGEELYKSITDGLRKRIRFYERLGTNVEGLKELSFDLHNMAYSEGIIRFMDAANEDINITVNDIKKFRLGEKEFTSLHYRNMKLMLEYYRPHIKELREYFEIIATEEDVLSEEQIEQASEVLDKLSLRLDSIDTFHRKMGVKLSKKWSKEQAEDTITDQNLLEKEKSIIDDTIREVDFDSNRMMYWAGSLVHARDAFQRVLHYAVSKVRRSVDRTTYKLGKRLTSEAERLGISDTSNLLERDSLGKFVGYFVDKFKTGQFIKAKEQFHYNLHEEFDLPQNKYERWLIKREWARATEAVEEGSTLPSDLEKADKYKAYNIRIAKWYAKNTVPIDNWQARVEEVKQELGGGTTPEFKEWKQENIGIGKRGTKFEYEYPKGELTQPSDGRVTVKTYGKGENKREFRTKTVDWTDPAWDKLTDAQKEYRDILIDVMEKVNQYTPRTKERNRLMLPQIKASTVDLLKAKKFSNIVENVKDLAKRAEDDTEFGEAEQIERPDGSIAQFVPIYFNFPLDNPDNISPDLTSSVIAYADVMENYRQMSTNVPTFEMVLDTIGRRKVTTDRKQMTGVESETYKTMSKFLEMNVFGKWKEPWIVGGVNVTKVMQNLVRFVTANNLAFSLYTTLASYFTSGVYSKIEDLVGQYTNQRNKNTAEKIWDTNIHQVLLETGKINKTSKLGLFFEHHRILKRNQDIFNNLDKSRLTRKAIQSGLYWSYELVKLRIRGKLALAIADNYKYYNGKFRTENELKNLGVENITELKSYWDMVDTKDGKLVALHDDTTIEDKIERQVEYIGSNIDGELNYSDWAAAHQGALTQLVTTHRGWLFRNIQLRLKPKVVNYQTGQEEQGFYRSFASFINKTIFSKERVTSIKGLLAEWNELSPAERHGVLRTIWEMAFIQAIAVLATILDNLAADDDEDDSFIQYAAYQTNRVLLEVGAMNPTLAVAYDPIANDLDIRPPVLTNVQELVAILNSPVAAARQIDDLMDITYIFSDEKLESGPFEGLSKRQRLLIKMTPGLKGYYQIRDPKSRNQYLRNRTLTWLND